MMTDLKNLSLEELENKIEELSKHYQENKMYFSPNLGLEEVLYAFYHQDEEYELIEEPMHRWYYELGQKYGAKGKLQEALKAYLHARDYNPTDFEVLDALAGVYYSLHDFDNMLAIINEMYPYIYCKNDMGKYYCRLGCYFLEKYHPEIAEALYMYSNLFCKNQQADVDLAYIEKAVGRKMQNASAEAVRQFLIANHIETQPKHETLGLLYHVAQKAIKNGQIEYGKQLLLFLYQLTRDEEVYQLLQRI